MVGTGKIACAEAGPFRSGEGVSRTGESTEIGRGLRAMACDSSRADEQHRSGEKPDQHHPREHPYGARTAIPSRTDPPTSHVEEAAEP